MVFLNEFAFDVSHCHLYILVKTEQHIGIEYALYAASCRTLCGDSDFVTRSQAWQFLDCSQAGVHCQVSLAQAGSRLMVSWERLVHPPEYAGLAFQPLTSFWGGGSYIFFFSSYAKMPTTYASHLETENKSHS